MNLTDYQDFAMSFRKASADGTYALLNLAGEVGELHSLIAKSVRDGRKSGHMDNIKKELGDILWCLAAVAKDYGFTLYEVADANLNKLASRSARGVIGGSGDDR